MLNNILKMEKKLPHWKLGIWGFSLPSSKQNFKWAICPSKERRRKAEKLGSASKGGIKGVSLQIFKAAEGKFQVACFMFVIELLV